MNMTTKSAKVKLPDKFNLRGGGGQDLQINFDMSFVCLNVLQRVNIIKFFNHSQSTY